MSITKNKELSSSSSSSFLQKFLGKVATVTKDGMLGLNSRPFADISNQKSKTSLVKHDDSNYLQVPKEVKQKSVLKKGRALKPINHSSLNTPVKHHSEMK